MAPSSARWRRPSRSSSVLSVQATPAVPSAATSGVTEPTSRSSAPCVAQLGRAAGRAATSPSAARSTTTPSRCAGPAQVSSARPSAVIVARGLPASPSGEAPPELNSPPSSGQNSSSNSRSWIVGSANGTRRRSGHRRAERARALAGPRPAPSRAVACHADYGAAVGAHGRGREHREAVLGVADPDRGAEVRAGRALGDEQVVAAREREQRVAAVADREVERRARPRHADPHRRAERGARARRPPPTARAARPRAAGTTRRRRPRRRRSCRPARGSPNQRLGASGEQRLSGPEGASGSAPGREDLQLGESRPSRGGDEAVTVLGDRRPPVCTPLADCLVRSSSVTGPHAPPGSRRRAWTSESPLSGSLVQNATIPAPPGRAAARGQPPVSAGQRQVRRPASARPDRPAGSRPRRGCCGQLPGRPGGAQAGRGAAHGAERQLAERRGGGDRRGEREEPERRAAGSGASAHPR